MTKELPWSIIYDRLLGLRVPKEVVLIGFRNDLPVVVVSMHPEDMELYGDETIHTITV